MKAPVQVVRESEVTGVRTREPHARTLKHLITPWLHGAEHLWIGESIVDVGSTSNPHVHPNEEVWFVLDGTGVAVVSESEVPLEPGTAVLVRGARRHQLRNLGDRPLRVLCIVSPPYDEEAFTRITST